MRSSCVGTGCAIREGPRPEFSSRASSAVPASGRAPVTVFAMWSGWVSPAWLRGERAAAAAAARGVRILEGEARALHRAHIIDRHAAQVLRAERVHEDLEARLVQDDV